MKDNYVIKSEFGNFNTQYLIENIKKLETLFPLTGTCTAIYVSTAENLVISLFAIWKNHGTAIILDSSRPLDGWSNVLEKLKVINVITDSWKETVEVKSSNIKKDVNIKSTLNSFWKAYCYNLKEDFIGIIIPTSGSTGYPKLVPISMRQVISKIETISDEFNLNKNTRELIALPINSLSAILIQILPTLINNGVIEIVSSYIDIKKIAAKLESSYADFVGMTPSMLTVLEKMDFNWSKNTVKNIGIGGEKINFKLLKQIDSVIGEDNKIFPLYGMTETTAAICGNYDKDRPTESVGKTYKGYDISVVNENNELVINKFGQILVRGLEVFSGYLFNEEENGKVFKEQWFKTGDIGKIDDNGYLYLKGRSKHIIISGGVNIYPEEIEEHLQNNPYIIQASVYSQKDKYLGEVPIAEIVTLNNIFISDDEIIKYCMEKFSTLQIPKKIIRKRKMSLIGLGKKKRGNINEA